ncbi:hypothetical protein PspLS_06306 [Pyricularia sp. CBS 133598]|nr:hypothetical protein PspLS_06306 [Pyricularia sp. CBS 133598]
MLIAGNEPWVGYAGIALVAERDVDQAHALPPRGQSSSRAAAAPLCSCHQEDVERPKLERAVAAAGGEAVGEVALAGAHGLTAGIQAMAVAQAGKRLWPWELSAILNVLVGSGGLKYCWMWYVAHCHRSADKAASTLESYARASVDTPDRAFARCGFFFTVGYGFQCGNRSLLLSQRKMLG